VDLSLIRGAGPSLDHMPGNDGLPVVGESLGFARDAEGWALRNLETHGPVFRTNLLFHRAAMFADPDAAKTVLLDRDRIFSNEGGWNVFIGKLFARGLMLRDFDDHRFHRRIMQEAFRSDAMAGYMDLIDPVIEDAVGRLEGCDQVDLYRVVKQLTLDIATVVFVGERPGRSSGRMNRAFIDAVGAAVTPVRREVPGSAFRRGMRGRRYLERFFLERIPQRRTAQGSDMLSRLCRAVDEDGARFTDEEIADHMIFLLLAAHDTSTGTLATMAWETAREPVWQERMRQEMAGIDGGRLTWGDRDRLELTEWVFREAMRLHPPVPFMPRLVLADTELAGYRVPRGSLIGVSSLLLHRLPGYWTDPASFDPLRFAPGRAEHRSHSHVFVPFGGGAHTCLGMHFAGLMSKAILTRLLGRFRLVALPGQRVEMTAVPIPRPRGGGLPLRLEPVA
jgi:cytochrome P450